MSLNGNVLLSHKIDLVNVADVSGPDLAPTMLPVPYKRLYTLQPGTFSAIALGGDITANNGFSLAPSPRAQLELLAAGNVNLKVGNDLPIVMLDVAPADMSPFYAPRLLELSNLTGQLSSDARRLTGRATGLSAHMAGGLHSGDAQPVRIVAASGDIVGGMSGVHALVLPGRWRSWRAAISATSASASSTSKPPTLPR